MYESYPILLQLPQRRRPATALLVQLPLRAFSPLIVSAYTYRPKYLLRLI